MTRSLPIRKHQWLICVIVRWIQRSHHAWITRCSISGNPYSRLRTGRIPNPPHPANCRGEPYHRGQKNVELATHYSQFGFSHCSKENLSIGSVKELLDAYVTHGSVNVFKTIYFATSQNLGSSRTELRQLNLHQYLCILKSAGR